MHLLSTVDLATIIHYNKLIKQYIHRSHIHKQLACQITTFYKVYSKKIQYQVNKNIKSDVAEINKSATETIHIRKIAANIIRLEPGKIITQNKKVVFFFIINHSITKFLTKKVGLSLDHLATHYCKRWLAK